MIESTRKCNMKCSHCLRGESQNISMKKEYLDSFLSNVSHITRMGFTGGEPTLPDGLMVIYDFIDICKKRKVSVGNFWIITNGKVWRREIGDAIKAMSELCLENTDSVIEISQDQFHDLIPEKRKYFYKQLQILAGSIPISIMTREKQLLKNHILSEGRASSNGLGDYVWSPSRIMYNSDDNLIHGEHVYVNCHGNIVEGCDLSYKSQDIPEHIICSVYDNIKQKVIERVKRKTNANL